jgi:hypothetical protein
MADDDAPQPPTGHARDFVWQAADVAVLWVPPQAGGDGAEESTPAGTGPGSSSAQRSTQ